MIKSIGLELYPSGRVSYSATLILLFLYGSLPLFLLLGIEKFLDRFNLL